ncbi:hypothetical protein KL866_10130 [Alteromonas sp. ALT199]|uniref:hypothetical protein n=1 Tax=unclassified Alteromonas TaxID=2614992 RepID=UPI001BE79E93|nr:hypothetical protein [Alteromonas sp. ALT199]MBT3135457.1 hypothetical protein [Alteromonas sp. ALT199]
MKRKTFDTETWIGKGEALLELGLNVSKEDTIHHETMNTIALNLPLLRKALNAGKKEKAEKITNELNSLNSDIDDKVWKIWSTRIRVKKNNEKKKTVRLENESLSYVRDYSKAKKTTVNSIFKNLNHEYFFVDKSQKKYLDAFAKLQYREKRMFKLICENIVNRIQEGKTIDLAEITFEVSTGKKNDFATKFGTFGNAELTIKTTKLTQSNKLNPAVPITVIDPLPWKILKLLVLLRRRYLP